MTRTQGTENASEAGPRFAPRVIASAIAFRIARLFLNSGLSFGDFQEIARRAFCEAAEEHVAKTGGRPTTSRIAVLTGLSRADVAKTRKQSGLPESRAHYKPRTDRVMHGWRSDPDFTDDRGAPVALARRGAKSIEDLCRRYSGDIPTKALLEELLARSLIEITAQDLFKPAAEGMPPPVVPELEAEEITASAGVFFDTYIDEANTSQAIRISTNFPARRVPAHVARTCRQRISKFMSALSGYIHAESMSAERSAPEAIRATINILILESENVGNTESKKKPRQS